MRLLGLPCVVRHLLLALYMGPIDGPNFLFDCSFKNGPILASFSVYFRFFNMLQFKFKFKLKKA